MKSKILIIEDNQDVRENLEEILSLSNYEVSTAENGKLGVQQAINNRPDLIICDIMMPELDGYGVLKILNSNPSVSTIPFIFLSAKAEKTDMRRGMMLGATDYLTKPFDDQELLEVIEMRLKKIGVSANANGTTNINLNDVNIDKAKSRLALLAEGKESRHIKKREILFEEGQKPRYIYYLTSGKVRTYLTNDNGKEYTNHIYSVGDVFCMQDVVNDRFYSKNAAAMEDADVSLIPISDFLDLLNKDRELQMSIMKLFASHMYMQDLALLHQAYSSVRRKVANSLIYLFEKNNGSNHFHVLREDLASIAGTAKETLIRTLTDFKNEGLISIDETEIEVINLNGLIHMQQ